MSADGKTLTGPDGFEIDLGACPSGWSETEGLSDTDIKIGQTIAQSWTLTASALHGEGQEPEGRRLRPGPYDPPRRRADRLREGLRDEHTGLAEPAQDLRRSPRWLDNEFGKIHEGGFRAYLDSSPDKAKIQYSNETVDLQAPTITDPMTTSAADSDVFIAVVAGTFCTQTGVEAAQNGMHENVMHENVKYLWQPTTCAGATQLGKAKVGGDGSASTGWWIVNGGSKDIREPPRSPIRPWPGPDRC